MKCRELLLGLALAGAWDTPPAVAQAPPAPCESRRDRLERTVARAGLPAPETIAAHLATGRRLFPAGFLAAQLPPGERDRLRQAEGLAAAASLAPIPIVAREVTGRSDAAFLRRTLERAVHLLRSRPAPEGCPVQRYTQRSNLASWSQVIPLLPEVRPPPRP